MGMSKLRENLRNLMARAGHTPYDIHQKTGIPPSTTYRFLEGDHGDPRSATVQKWANLYGVSESQLRGDLPIEGIESKEKSELKDLLPLEEYNHVRLIRSLPDDSRNVVYKMAAMLAEPRAVYCADRRVRDVVPNPQQRVGEARYKSPPAQRRIKSNDRQHVDCRKTPQSA